MNFRINVSIVLLSAPEQAICITCELFVLYSILTEHRQPESIEWKIEQLEEEKQMLRFVCTPIDGQR